MKNGWIKYFVDGQIIKGADNQHISWSRTKLDGLIRVEVFLDGKCISLNGQGQYHQSDDYVMLLTDIAKPQLYSRRLQYKLDTGKWLTITIFRDGGLFISLEDEKI